MYGKNTNWTNFGNFRSNRSKQKNSEVDLDGHIVKLKTKTEAIFPSVDSGSPMPLFDCRKMTNQRYSKIAPPEDAARFLACYNGVYIIPIERPITVIDSGG